MNVLLICNSLMRGNGVRSAVLSLRSRLAGEGRDIRIMACENDDTEDVQPDFPLRHFQIPLFEPILSSNGFRFAEIDEAVIKEAVAWADVVHIMEGFPLEAAVVKAADEMCRPCVGTYHTFSENITANLGLPEGGLLNRLINLWWKTVVYDHCKSVQCPSQTVKDYLLKHGYKSPLEVISNGVDMSGSSLGNEPEVKPFRIINIGRLSSEKLQLTLIEAVRYSRHASDIELYFAGSGPKAKKVMREARKLYEDGVVRKAPSFGFYDSAHLKELLRTAYLFIHCAKVEVEGLSCLEAISQGVVPVIADSVFSASSQFALDERSLYPVSDPQKLAERIDWWIEHPEERGQMSLMYAESAKRYDISDSLSKIIRMYERALGREAV